MENNRLTIIFKQKESENITLLTKESRIVIGHSLLIGTF